MIRSAVLISAFILMVILLPPGAECDAGQLYLTKGQIYNLAALDEDEGAELLDEIRDLNPDLPLNGLTREGSTINLHHSSGQLLQIRSNELYSLAVYVPQGIESDISRRSGDLFRIGRISREEDGIRFYFGSPPRSGNRDLAGILSDQEKVRSVPLPATGSDRSRVTLKQPRPAGSLNVRQEPAKPGNRVVAKSLSRTERVQEILRRAVNQADEIPDPGSDVVTAVKLPDEPSPVQPDPQSAALLTARFRERAARQPQVEPLSERVSSVGVPPRRSRRKQPLTPSRKLTVKTFAGNAPVLDGVDTDAAWTGVQRSVFSFPGAEIRVEAAAVTDGDQLYLLITWPQSVPSRYHRPWTWNKNSGIYERGGLLDDGVAVRWQMGTTPQTSRREYDLWVWRAGREGAGSYASDMKLLMDEKPFYMASDMQVRGRRYWARIDFDRGRLPFEIVLPSSFSGPEVVSYVPSSPDGSASDVKSAGRWDQGRWVVEMARALKTGHEDDVPFNREGKYAFIFNLLQGKDLEESPASEVLTLIW